MQDTRQSQEVQDGCILRCVEDKTVGRNSKGELYLCVGCVLVSCNIPEMPAISVAVFLKADDGHCNQS